MPQKYNQSFQGLRGIAILLIVFSHCSFFVNDYGNNTLMYCGGLGVSLFIMLSGYLTLYHHYDSEIDDFKAFFFTKIKKFYPLHLLTFIAALPFFVLGLKEMGGLKAGFIILTNLTLTQTWIPSSSFYFSLNAVSWYLSVTVFFIALTPIIIKLFRKLSHLQIKAFLVILVLIDLLWTLLTMNRSEAHWLIYILPLARLKEFLIGGGGYFY